MSYYDRFNPTLLEEVNPAATAFLEFGCGSGAMAVAVRDRLARPLRYVGVDIEAAALERSGDALDLAIRCNLDEVGRWDADPQLGQLAGSRFDHIIFGDVLEHLRDPQRLLDEAAQRLAPGGTVLACIPNVQHWSVFIQLVRGSWPREDGGLFDRTHLRWFALADMQELMRHAGLAVEKVIPRVFNEEQGRDVLEYLEPLAMWAGVDVEQFMRQGLALQYVIVARQAA